MKILVVEDSSTIKKIIKATIESMGYTAILEASDGAEAMQTIDANPDINLVITDKNMPNMDGVELTRLIRSKEATSSISVVMITSESAKEDIANAMEIGVTDYIVKPVTQQILREKLKPIFDSIEA